MSDNTGIEWTDATWNPTKGCDRVSAGCDHCYAMTMAKRLKAMGQVEYQRDGDPRTSGPGFLAHESPNDLDWPLRRRKPLRIFVNSMSDLFHANISDEFIAQVFAVMALAPQHTFQVLTKRHARMRALLNSDAFADEDDGLVAQHVYRLSESPCVDLGRIGWPLPNVWVGVSVESQRWADIRIPALLDTPAAVRFLSCEPLLGAVTLHRALCSTPGRCYNHPKGSVDWVICGGESGPGARPMHPDWARSMRDQCADTGVPFLFKQWGEWAPPWTTDLPAGPASIHRFADGKFVVRAGKKRAGRELDGRTWDEYPGAVS